MVSVLTKTTLYGASFHYGVVLASAPAPFCFLARLGKKSFFKAGFKVFVFSCVAIAGSRFGSPYAVEPVVSSILKAGGSIRVGCARGVDQAVRVCCPSATVLSAASFGQGRWSFAARTKAVVSGASALCIFPPANHVLGPGSSLALRTAFSLNLPIWQAGPKPQGKNWQPLGIGGVSGFVLVSEQSKLF